MFITLDHSRSPYPVAGSGISGWSLMEMSTPLPFFLVGASVKLEGENLDTTFVVDSFWQLNDLIKSHLEGSRTINFAHLLWPKQILKPGPWTMHRLSKVYGAREVSNPDQSCYVYESNEGRIFIDSLSAKSLDDVCDLAEIHVFTTNDV